jgi:VIT1/CCC1 family predicted Fe2+/Mn2+ transporter
VGEYVSVSSQRDTERADIARETWELENEADKEFAELIGIYEAKGLSHDLAQQVAAELTKNDALKAHLAEELGITEHNTTQPVQAAVSSAIAFATGASVPLLAMAVASHAVRYYATITVVILALIVLGYSGARFGGAAKALPIARVLIGGLAAMAITMLIGHWFGTSVA